MIKRRKRRFGITINHRTIEHTHGLGITIRAITNIQQADELRKRPPQPSVFDCFVRIIFCRSLLRWAQWHRHPPNLFALRIIWCQNRAAPKRSIVKHGLRRRKHELLSLRQHRFKRRTNLPKTFTVFFCKRQHINRTSRKNVFTFERISYPFPIIYFFWRFCLITLLTPVEPFHSPSCGQALQIPQQRLSKRCLMAIYCLLWDNDPSHPLIKSAVTGNSSSGSSSILLNSSSLPQTQCERNGSPISLATFKSSSSTLISSSTF